ncbi:MAG: precorrin-2 C(20)-methyltransferase [Nitrospirae bacterium GWD2_57_9]|nr:MAG: precorrin-2 C(20)-methyltransferase [Nitrospirae bacterium GWD2_57_9]OGW47676.1 MAG: precorrin-2 C(20)-methyltransferase [Nitrospirae bacterium GWC2_57_9]
MTGKLYAVGIGPGDPELMTIKAVRILKQVPCIVVPKGREEGSSLALSIVQKILPLDGKEIVEAFFPMKKTMGGEREDLDHQWNETVDAVLNRLDRGTDAAFITIGDPGIYSTFFYLYDRLLERRPSLAIEIIPGISSINAAAARAGVYLGLGNERIAILPANYLESLQETLEKFDTVVLMKVNKVFDTVREILEKMDLAGNAVYVARTGMEDERIYNDIRTVGKEDLNYFSLMIVRKR